jgi:hypothetical protein
MNAFLAQTFFWIRAQIAQRAIGVRTRWMTDGIALGLNGLNIRVGIGGQCASSCIWQPVIMFCRLFIRFNILASGVSPSKWK